MHASIPQKTSFGAKAQVRSDSRFERRLHRFGAFLKSGAFPFWMLALLAFYQAFLALMVFAPPFGSAWGTFSEDFLIKCFNYNPESGSMQWATFWVMIGEPLPIQLALLTLWRRSLWEFLRSGLRAILPLAASAFGVVVIIAASLMWMWRTDAAKPEEPFPADRIRSALPMPAFTLMNQDGLEVSRESFKGKVTLFTAVYSSCTKTCPMLLTQIRAVIDQLSPAERAKLTVVAFSLNPEQDTRELRTMTAKIYGLASPDFHFVNGDARQVNELLDKLQIARERNPETGELQHANLFFLLDRAGSIAYRLSLSKERPSWLLSAVRTLIHEPAPTVP